ncbi:MAG: hypothetical protein LBB75_05630 [Oscillospiraceae bacterium]|jgi:hypothetical protein|nr:hypothetical protein [Oscillospiraceae bacterium]
MRIEKTSLQQALSNMLGAPVLRASRKTKPLKGGTLGDVRLVSGMAKTADGRKLPYRLVLKTQKKWERPGDPVSWRREIDLYASGFGAVLGEALRWPVCCHAELSGGGTRPSPGKALRAPGTAGAFGLLQRR